MKKIIISLLIIAVIVVWYFFAPIKWTFGLREPRNYRECIKLGGNNRLGDVNQGIGDYGSYCNYKGKDFNNGVFNNI